jgi:hypothetical protein
MGDTMNRDQVRQLAQAAFDSETGHALRAREARWLLVCDMAGNADAARHAMEGVGDSPDGGAALATAHLADLDENEARQITETVDRLAFTLCIQAADEAQAAAQSMLVKPEGIEPDTVALLAATELVRQRTLERAAAAGS